METFSIIFILIAIYVGSVAIVAPWVKGKAQRIAAITPGVNTLIVVVAFFVVMRYCVRVTLNDC